MRRFLAILALVIIMLLLLIAAFAGTPTDADAASEQLIYSYSRLTATTAEATICQRELTGDGLTGEMFITPWNGNKGMPLELHLELKAHNGDCWTFTGSWEPQPGYYPWTYQADSNFQVNGQPFYYDWQSASYSKSVFIPMAFRNIPDTRPELEP